MLLRWFESQRHLNSDLPNSFDIVKGTLCLCCTSTQLFCWRTFEQFCLFPHLTTPWVPQAAFVGLWSMISVCFSRKDFWFHYVRLYFWWCSKLWPFWLTLLVLLLTSLRQLSLLQQPWCRQSIENVSSRTQSIFAANTFHQDIVLRANLLTFTNLRYWSQHIYLRLMKHVFKMVLWTMKILKLNFDIRFKSNLETFHSSLW